MKHFLLHLIIYISILVAHSCSDDLSIPTTTGPKPTYCEKVVITYIAAENNIYNYAELDLQEMQQSTASIPANCRMITYVDDLQKPCIYEFAPNKKTKIHTYIKDHCSTDATTLKNVLTYIQELYPAKKYGLILWSHGSNWLPSQQYTPSTTSNTPQTFSFGIDSGKNDGSNSGPSMNIIPLANALSHLPHFEFIYFDACWMMGIETLYELKDHADFIMGSPAETPGYGAPYHKLMSSFFENPIQPEKITDIVYEHYKNSSGILFSAVRNSELENLARATSSHIQQLFVNRSEPSTTGVQAYSAHAVQTSYSPEFFDMNSFMYKHLSPNEYNIWLEFFDKAVITRKATSKWQSDINPYFFTPEIMDMLHFGGISMHIPHSKYNAYGWNDSFRNFAWYHAAGWSTTGW